MSRHVFNTWEDQLPMMGNFVVVESRFRLDLDGYEYLAFSPLFDVIPEAMAAPEYEIEVAWFPNAPAVIRAYRKDGMSRQKPG